jgi:hypothetical protein
MNFTNRHFNPSSNPFRSFWMGGFECTDMLNAFGNRVDFFKLTGHSDLLFEDYKMLRLLNIKTVREGIRWNCVERQPYVYDWTEVDKMISASKRTGIQIVWDICHFGFPDDLTPLHPMFARRFATVCAAFVRHYRMLEPGGDLIITPINEVGFLSWLGGDACGTAPYCRNYGFQVKYELMRAYIEAIEAMKNVDQQIRILITEPLVNIVPSLDATEEEIINAKGAHESQFQMLDMLSGKICPELRGRPEYVDIIGLNFYFTNQFVFPVGELLPWLNEVPDVRWKYPAELIEALYKRYNRPMILAETSHPGEDRPLWLDFIAAECKKILKKEIPLWGICWYPVIDRPDWDHLLPWHKSGLWDVEINENDSRKRLIHYPTFNVLIKKQMEFNYLLEAQPKQKRNMI